MQTNSNNEQHPLQLGAFDVKAVQPKFNWSNAAEQSKSSEFAWKAEAPESNLSDTEAKELLKGQIACLFGVEGRSFEELNETLAQLGLA
ncbi:MAG: hypothetical protein ACI8UO_002226 [Verrucomicrobiales bacterium]|jgi:hypothetical protein